MKMTRLHTLLWLFLGLLLLLQSGCASNTYWTWEHNDLDSAQLNSDREECRQLARLEVDRNRLYHDFWLDPFYWPYDPRWPHSFYRDNWHWRTHDRFFHDRNLYERFFRLCIRAKGWQRVKKTREAQD